MSAFLASRGMGGSLVASAGMGDGGGSAPSDEGKYGVGGNALHDQFIPARLSTDGEWRLRRRTLQ